MTETSAEDRGAAGPAGLGGADSRAERERLIAALARELPPLVRWGGRLARRLREYDIALGGKASGRADTDALTLADLAVQELLVDALADGDPIFRRCRLDAEETTGDLARFATDGAHTLAIDPIDGTRHYRDRVGRGYSTIVTLRSVETAHYTLIFVPEGGEAGTWLQVSPAGVAAGADDPLRPAAAVVRGLPPVRRGPTGARQVRVMGFQRWDGARTRRVAEAGLETVTGEAADGCLFERLARGELGAFLVHTPNVYDFPAALHIVRALGGDAVWVRDGRPVDFAEQWLDERARMWRLPGIVAASPDRAVLATLCGLARDWNPVRYAD